MKYEVIRKSWSKRRKLDQQKEIENIDFEEFKKEHNHFCKMKVYFSDGTKESLLARVIFNEIKQHWIVDGLSVAVRLQD